MAQAKNNFDFDEFHDNLPMDDEPLTYDDLLSIVISEQQYKNGEYENLEDIEF